MRRISFTDVAAFVLVVAVTLVVWTVLIGPALLSLVTTH
jgi:hypothetical protein